MGEHDLPQFAQIVMLKNAFYLGKLALCGRNTAHNDVNKIVKNSCCKSGKSREVSGMSKTTKVISIGGRDRKLFRQPGGNWYIRFQLNGREVEKSLKTDLLKTAEEKARSLFETVQNGQEVDPSNITIGALMERFIGSRVGMGEGTVKNDNYFARIFSETFQRPMHTLVSAIVPSDLKTWLDTQTIERPWKSRTHNHGRMFLYQVFKMAVADGRIAKDKNPFDPEIIRRRKLDAVRRDVPTLDEFNAIIADARANEVDQGGEECSKLADKRADFLEFLGLAGVGQAEALALRWRDVSNTHIRFIRRKTKKPFDVPIFSWLAPLILKLKAQANGSEKVFEQVYCAKTIVRVCRRLGYTFKDGNKKHPLFSQRSLRQMCINRLFDAGVPVKQIALWQGHTDGGKLILDTYTQIRRASDAAAEQANLAKVGAINLASVEALSVVK